MMESKKQIYDLIPQHYYPKTILLLKGTDAESAGRAATENKINFPFIAKPDIGMRGAAVRKIENIDQLKNYAEKANFDYLIQEFVALPNEAGIFYVRFPGDEKGKITGIVSKEFLIVTGNGHSTIEQLIKKNPRYALQYDVLKTEFGNALSEILPDKEKRNLVPFGNHCRGSKFIDATHWVTPQLTETIDAICRQIDGFYFGRIDMMYADFESLEKGENIGIIELNGAGSEPTHIYDPKHSILFAWKEIFRHTSMMFKIGYVNHKKGLPYLTFKDGREQFRLHKEHNKNIASF